MTQDETEKVVSSKSAEEDAIVRDLCADMDEIIPPLNTPKEVPPLPLSSVKKIVVSKKELPGASVMKMKLKDIELSSKWNRDKLQNIDKLAQSIQAEGQITPILVRLREDGKAILVDGRRRYAALKEAGIAEALVSVRDCDEREARRISTAANTAREEHTPLELCRTFSDMRDAGETIKQIAVTTCHSENVVAQHLRLECLPDEAKKMLNAGKLDFTAAHALCRLNYDDNRDLKFFDKVLTKIKTGKLTALSVATVVDTWINRRKEADKAAGKKEEKKRGRKVTSKKENYDYLDPSYLKQIKPLSAKQIGSVLNTYQEKKNNARNANIRGKYDYFMQGVQAAAGLAQID
jgi:ParB/RepB/Spo0J family partition protein